MKAYRRVEVYFHAFIFSALVGGVIGRFIRGEGVPLSIGRRLGGFQVWYGLFGEGILYELCVFNIQLVVCMCSCSFMEIKVHTITLYNK
jgi:hypothetical protein